MGVAVVESEELGTGRAGANRGAGTAIADAADDLGAGAITLQAIAQLAACTASSVRV